MAEGQVCLNTDMTEYKLHLGHVKYVLESGGHLLPQMNALSTETVPIVENHVILFNRPSNLQHGPGLANFPSG